MRWKNGVPEVSGSLQQRGRILCEAGPVLGKNVRVGRASRVNFAVKIPLQGPKVIEKRSLEEE